MRRTPVALFCSSVALALGASSGCCCPQAAPSPVRAARVGVAPSPTLAFFSTFKCFFAEPAMQTVSSEGRALTDADLSEAPRATASADPIAAPGREAVR